MEQRKRHIALLRAINVGGHRKIKMNELREMFFSMEFDQVATYIQSGNVVFDSTESDTEKLSRSIERQLKETFGFEVIVITRSLQNLESLVAKNPFENRDRPPFRLYVTFFRKTPSRKKQLVLEARSGTTERFSFIGGDLFSLIDKKTSERVNFSNNYAEKAVGIAGTTRNWKSVNKILDLAGTGESV